MQLIWQSLSKAIPEDNRRIWLQIRWPSPWDHAQAQLRRFGQARKNTKRFRVGCSRCWQARLRKTCFHSCETDSVRESTRFSCFVDIWPRRVNFFSCNFRRNWREIVANQSSAHCFAQSFDHCWPLSKNITLEQNHRFRIESCAKQQI